MAVHVALATRTLQMERYQVLRVVMWQDKKWSPCVVRHAKPDVI